MRQELIHNERNGPIWLTKANSLSDEPKTQNASQPEPTFSPSAALFRPAYLLRL